MSEILLVGEDQLCCGLAVKLVRRVLPDWSIAGAPINKRGITRQLPELHRYAECARYVRPVLCVADTDHRCAVELRQQWLPEDPPDNFLFRLAVSEAESWVLADREGVAAFFDVPLKVIPRAPEQLHDAKQEVLRIAARSSRHEVRAEMLAPGRLLKPGAGYNVHLARLVAENWEVDRASAHSDSLERAIAHLRIFEV